MINIQKYFIDKLSFLKSSATKGTELRRQTEEYVNRELPSRLSSKANIFNTMLNVIEEYCNLFYGVIASNVKESNIMVAERPTSVRGLSQLSGHTATRPISARGVVSIRQTKGGIGDLGNVFSMDKNTKFKSLANNLTYCLDSNTVELYRSSSNTAFFNLIEGTRVSSTFVADGYPFFTIHLDDDKCIENYDVTVTVNGVPYTKADSVNDMFAGKLVYLLTNGFSNQVDITFGDETHGRQLSEGDVVVVEYLQTNGEYGNVEDGALFEIVGGLFDTNGDETDITRYVTITKESGFDLGSNGEHITMTRKLAGYSSRSLTFPRPENVSAYLSRLSMLSSIRTKISPNDDRIMHITALPNLVVTKPTDYFYLPESKLVLSESVKGSIKSMLNASRRQMLSTEFVFVDPTIKKYGLFLYIDATVYDKKEFKSRVLGEVAKVMAKNTYSPTAKTVIPKSEIENAIHDMNDVSRSTAQIMCKENEDAKRNGYYNRVVEKVVGGVTVFETERVVVNGDPNLGFTDIGDISVNEMEIPIIRGGWGVHNNSFVFNETGVHIFLYGNSGWGEI